MSPAYARLRSHVTVVELPHELRLYGDRVMRFRAPPRRFVEAIRALERGVAFDDLCELVGTPDVTQALLAQLSARGTLHESDRPFAAPPDDPTAAYLESISQRPYNQKSLATASVWIIGCGGVGGLVAQHLVAAGISRLTLVDFDVVNESNLNRQFLFTRADIGRDKLTAAKERLLALRGDVEIDLIRHRLQPGTDLPLPPGARADACICAADTPPVVIASLVSRLAARLDATFALAGVGVLRAYWGPILRPDDVPRYHDWVAAQEDPVAATIPPPHASFGPTNSFAAACLARDLIHVLVGEHAPSLRCGIAFDFQTLETRRIPVTSHAA